MITVYTKNVCPYCVKAKNYLENKGIEYETVNIEENQTERNWLMENGFRSVPQIFVNKKLLVEGGANELIRMSKEEILNKQQELIEETNAGNEPI